MKKEHRIGIRVSEELKEKIQKHILKEKKTISEFIVTLLDNYFNFPLSQHSSLARNLPKITPDQIVDLYNKRFGKERGFCRGLGANKHLHNFLEAAFYLDTKEKWSELFDMVDKSEWLSGKISFKNRPAFKADLLWLVNYDNALKVLNGNFQEGHSNFDQEALAKMLREKFGA